MVWRKPRKKQRVIFICPNSWKKSPDPLQSRLQTIPRVKAVRKKMKRIDSLREARTLLFGLCNHRKIDARRESFLEGKPPLDNLHQEKSGLQGGLELVPKISASGHGYSVKPANQASQKWDQDGMNRKRAQLHLERNSLKEPQIQNGEASKRARPANGRWRIQQLGTTARRDPRYEKTTIIVTRVIELP